MRELWRLLALLISISIALSRACISSAPRQYAAPTQFQQAPVGAPQQAFVGAPRVAAPNFPPQAPLGPSVSGAQPTVFEQILGRSVRLSEFGVEGYNAEGGGPVNSGSALTCNFDGRPCCWANVPQPDDQLDWSIATGKPDAPAFRSVPTPDGSYLIAYARGAAPSDEAQFASCSIGCASSPITVRAKHWQSENVLLQVCQRESFPNTVNFNPLLNCQEFPLVQGVGTTEVVLPKASLVDIVFVASNFVGEQGDLAILDDIEVSYDRNGAECSQDAEEDLQKTKDSKDSKAESAASSSSSTDKEPTDGGIDENAASGSGKSRGDSRAVGGSAEGIEGFGQQSGNAAGASGSAGASGASSSLLSRSETSETEETLVETSAKSAKAHAKKTTSLTSTAACLAAKCTFEDGTTCSYKDAHQTESIRGLTTKFQVVTGQFMNRVTGVKESSEGNFYAASFLYPREMAGLEASTGGLDGERRLRFQYYEGTHGVQLKACCDSVDTCPFSSDRFVSVGDRTWKYASFLCPKGTDKIIFLCENTRTNQGACAIDDIQIIANSGSANGGDRPLC